MGFIEKKIVLDIRIQSYLFAAKSNAPKKAAPRPSSTGALVTLSSLNSVLGAKFPSTALRK